jgi:phosphoribosylglycinamide formyltransferase-1
LARAQGLGIDVALVDHRAFGRDRQGFEAALLAQIDASRPDIVCLAGFMRILSAQFVQTYAGRLLNIHPSLLPKYPGLNTHARALAAGDTMAGCTVHLVTSQLDAGPVLGQTRVPILADDTVQALSARVLVQEHLLYPMVLERFAAGIVDPVWL